MRARQPLALISPKPRAYAPRCWMMLDARLGAALGGALRALPPRSAIVVRPHALPEAGRALLIRKVRRAARARRHLLLLAGKGPLMGFDGWHGARATQRRNAKMLSMPVHDRREAERARRWRADVVLISPLFPTRSHPGAAEIGLRGFARLAATSKATAIALGGMDARRFRAARRHGAHGWAAIDAWLTKQD